MNNDKTLAEITRDVTSDAVNTSRSNVRNAAEKLGDMLAKMPLQEHKAVMAILETETQLREQSMGLAVEEFRRKEALAQQRERERRAHQARANGEDANQAAEQQRPRLAQ